MECICEATCHNILDLEPEQEQDLFQVSGDDVTFLSLTVYFLEFFLESEYKWFSTW